MHIIYSRSVILFIVLLIAYASAATDLEINGAKKAGADAEILSTNSNVNENLDPINTNSKSDVHLDKISSSNQLKPKKAVLQRKISIGTDASTDVGDQNKSKDNSVKKSDEGKGFDGAEKQEKSNDSISEKQVQKEILLTRKESFHGEECDSPHSCTIEKKSVVACLRVPGNESPDLSLLIQNKGESNISVLIMAPKSVQLEKNKIELQGKENHKMKVSIGNPGNENFIILKAGDGQCSLDFKGLIDQSDKASQFKYVFPSFGIVCLVALVAIILVYIKRRLRVANGGHKYQKLDVGLPVSVGVKSETASTDGWDNSWDDNWDDMEAVSVTPLSSKGISGLRSAKEGWKD